MAESVRTLRQRIRAVRSTKKITKAMELIAASRIAKAQLQVKAATPYADAITDVITQLASQAGVEHPLTTANPEARRAAIIVVTSDRGLAGAYSANAIRAAERLSTELHAAGKETVLFAIGRKALGFYKFRGRPVEQSWTGFSEQPQYSDAKAAAAAVIDAFTTPTDEGGIDEIYLVYTQFVSMLTQNPVAVRVLPMELPEAEAKDEHDGVGALYEFEPGAIEVLDALLPRYVESRIYAGLLASAASESASRRRAMQSASDNADDLIKSYTRAANQARQALITQEISEIVGGADALASA